MEHIHGAHVSGMGDHDYVLRPVLPGHTMLERTPLVACTSTNHPIALGPGAMGCSHPHAHGRVAYQFLGGAYGLSMFMTIPTLIAALMTSQQLGRQMVLADI